MSPALVGGFFTAEPPGNPFSNTSREKKGLITSDRESRSREICTDFVKMIHLLLVSLHLCYFFHNYYLLVHG